MKSLIVFVALLAAFGAVGRIDYESQLAMAGKAIARSDVAGSRAAMQTAQRYLAGMTF